MENKLKEIAQLVKELPQYEEFKDNHEQDIGRLNYEYRRNRSISLLNWVIKELNEK